MNPMSNPRSNIASPTAEANAVSIQAAFRDVTNYYLSANKENVPPAGASLVGPGGRGKDNGRGCVSLSASSAEPGVDRMCCGTPVQTYLNVDVPSNADVLGGLVSAVYDSHEVVREDAVGTHSAAVPLRSPLAPLARTTAAGLTAVTPNTHKSPHATATCAATPSITSDSSFLSAARTPGHNAPPSARSAGGFNPAMTASTATKLLQQRSRGLGSPFFAQGKAGSAVSPATDAAPGVSGGAQVLSQSPLHCTPSGARRSAAAAVAARALSETPTRIDDISFYLNNSFESGSESPTHGGVAAVRTPHRTFDLQQAVEEMLRGCLDSATPTKGSDASGASASGSHVRQLQRLDAGSAATVAGVPFDSYAALESLFAAPALSKASSATNVWGQGFAMMVDHTPERLAAPQGVYAESDNDDGSISPYSDHASRGVPSAGVRRDPMVYFSTSAVAATTATSVESAPTQEPAQPRSAVKEPMLLNGDRDAICCDEPPSCRGTRRHSAGFKYHNDGHTNGPDILAMLAAAVQQQSPRCAGGASGEMESQTFSDLDAGAAATALLPPPPSYDDGHQQSRCPRRNAGMPSGTAGAAHAPQPVRRSHHLPQVKAAAGSLIAVSGRRVPVDKLHLLSLSLGDESAASGAVAGAAGPRHASRGGAARSKAHSSPTQQHHVEGPSMRRVPKANVVTVTRAPASAGSGRSPNANAPNEHGTDGLQSVSTPASLLSSSNTGRADIAATRTTAATATTRVIVPGPSARRVPPTAHPTASLHSRQSTAAASVDREGVRQSSERDVVAVLQFSKGQTMRFLANLSATALAAAQAALTRDLENSIGSRNDECDCAATARARLARAPISQVEVGKSYLAHVYGDQSPYKNVAFEDVGVCVRLYTASTSTPANQACREHVSGVLLREVDVFESEEDRQQHQRGLQLQTSAYIECERQFKFSSLPFQLESIYFTFDGSICVVFYRVVTTESAAPATLHRCTNTSRVVRELQFHLNCRVFLKQC
ncbi:hypothetical protein ABL78_0464 [Leptomonas seymouri]|uniref:PSP1 C-terminal domain-containing protein n=1 Tax=Leptomonas seymouri TaxID=5684 RepID=A0A0N1IA65_LEPSE|nr:hypothetical protein ABL78_0464 [Leptomonas seymouri]|eukprot:KPI90388.1 hypothetical protein ABL78_0464 [Leptomonas seymouri]